jgi:hypothetical protein
MRRKTMDIYLDGRTDITIHAGTDISADLAPGRYDEMDPSLTSEDLDDPDGNVDIAESDELIAADLAGWYFTFPADHPLADYYVRIEGSRVGTWEAMSAVHPDWQWQYSGEEFIKGSDGEMPMVETGTPLL